MRWTMSEILVLQLQRACVRRSQGCSYRFSVSVDGRQAVSEICARTPPRELRLSFSLPTCQAACKMAPTKTATTKRASASTSKKTASKDADKTARKVKDTEKATAKKRVKKESSEKDKEKLGLQREKE